MADDERNAVRRLMQIERPAGRRAVSPESVMPHRKPVIRREDHQGILLHKACNRFTKLPTASSISVIWL